MPFQLSSIGKNASFTIPTSLNTATTTAGSTSISRMTIPRRIQTIVFLVLLFDLLWRNASLISSSSYAPTAITTTPTDCQHQRKDVEERNMTSTTANDSSTNQTQLLLSQSIRTVPIGSLGPKNTNREHLMYYDSLYFLSMQYASTATNVLEVGCAKEPFVNYFTWIPSKDCVAPYFVDYEQDNANSMSKNMNKTDNHPGRQQEHRNINNNNNNNNNGELSPISSTTRMILADFATWDPSTDNITTPSSYDLIVCSQVVEHVDKPRQFVQKILSMTKHVAIISVPYNWRPCKNCHHKTHYIKSDKMKSWSEPYTPIYETIITEPQSRLSRLLMVFSMGKE